MNANPRHGPTREELAETTAHSLVYLRRLRHAQLVLSLHAFLAFAGLVGALPLVLFLVPRLQRVDVFGLPLPLLLLLVPFPLFVAIGWVFERRAEGLEDAFQDLFSEEDL